MTHSPGTDQGRHTVERPIIGLIGLGHLGTALAYNLLRAGFQLWGYDVIAERRNANHGPGFHAAASLADLGAAAEVIITCVISAKQMQDIVSGDGGLGTLTTGKTIVDLSTISVEGSARVAALVDSLGGIYIRAAVSGNPITARTRDVSFVCSGPAQAYEAVAPILEAMGKKRRYVGDADEARAAKLATNLVVGSMMVLLAEAVAYGASAGLAPQTLMDILADSAIGSPFVTSKTHALVTRDFASIADVSLIVKDMVLLSDHARSLGLDLPVSASAKEQYVQCVEHGWARDDMATVLRLYGHAG